jgi:anti-sigma factor RsiW
MEHSYIEDHNIAERYLSGKLSPEERMRFEEHFVDCTHCLDRLEPTDDLRDGRSSISPRPHLNGLWPKHLEPERTETRLPGRASSQFQ